MSVILVDIYYSDPEVKRLEGIQVIKKLFTLPFLQLNLSES